jgi:hypothetical protein
MAAMRIRPFAYSIAFLIFISNGAFGDDGTHRGAERIFGYGETLRGFLTQRD